MSGKFLHLVINRAKGRGKAKSDLAPRSQSLISLPEIEIILCPGQQQVYRVCNVCHNTGECFLYVLLVLCIPSVWCLCGVRVCVSVWCVRCLVIGNSCAGGPFRATASRMSDPSVLAAVVTVAVGRRPINNHLPAYLDP